MLPNPALASDNPFLYQQQLIEHAKLQRQALALEQRAKSKANKVLRTAAGEVWEDPTLADWPKDDYRIFVGNLGNDVTDEALRKAFSAYKSLGRVRVIRDKKTGKTRGFGFVSLLDAKDYVLAMREMQGQFIMNRPCLLRKSDWAERNVDANTRVKKNQFRKSIHAKPYKKPPLKPFFPTANNFDG
jgi:RNA recognition motif-containing protein